MADGCQITAISWERVNLSLMAHLSADAEFSTAMDATEPGRGSLPVDLAGDVTFLLVDGERELPVDTELITGARSVDGRGPDGRVADGGSSNTSTGGGDYRLTMSVTNFHDRKQVPNGAWKIVPVVGGRRGPAAGYDLSQMEELDDASRTFLYAQNRVCYVVTFAVTESDDPDLVMRTYQMYRPASKPAPGREKPPLARRVRRKVLPRARRVRLANRWYQLSRRINPPTGNRILFASEMRTGLEGNLSRVHDRMIERGLDNQYSFRYSFRVPRMVNRKSTLRLIYLIATSDVVLIDDYFGLLEMLHLSEQTKIIQAWHAGSGFKSIGYSRFGKYGSPKLQNAHRKVTYAITGSQHLVPVYAEAFGIEEAAVIPTGLPRIDTFLDPARIEQVKRDFYSAHPQFEGKQIILFAPTFRGRGAGTAYYDYGRLDLTALYELCGRDTVVLFRMHHFIREPIDIPARYRDRLYDFAHFPDVNDLLQVTDVLVTDYSSIIYEFSLLDRPMVFFAYDKELYAATRGFHRDFDETAPGKICTTFDEVIKAIQSQDYEMWKVAAFREENFDIVDTNAGDRVIDWLILGDPHTSRFADSEAAVRDPATGDTVINDTVLSDQSEA